MLYGKWRPRSFDEVAGQDHIVTTLRNAVLSGQVAHAYLFTGPRGTGKTTSARILAKAINCAAPVKGDPCNECPACQAINSGSALDLIEMDAASNRGIDEVRDLRDRIAYAPSDLTKKVYLLDEAHMLTTAAANALLKTLEEPPPHAIFILATTDPHALPATILSRCQRFDFRRIDDAATVARLEVIARGEGFEVPEEGLRLIARQARGGLRDAVTLLEQVVAQYGPSPSTDQVEESLGIVADGRTGQLAEAILARDLGAALGVAMEVADDGVELQRFTRNTIEVLRDRVHTALASGEKGARLSQEIAPILSAVDALASADFKKDPASPVPLELAVAAAILGDTQRVAPAAAAAGPPAAAMAQGGQRPVPSRPVRSGGAQAEETANLTAEQAFLKKLYLECQTESMQIAAYLNGSCEVISLSDDAVEIGFFHQFHMEQVENKGRPVIESVASRILSRPVTLRLKSIQRSEARARAPKGGHLVQAARSIEGATPVAKE